jgi:hypothetical protein
MVAHRFRVLENRTLRRIIGPYRMKEHEAEENCVMSFIIYTARQILLE